MKHGAAIRLLLMRTAKLEKKNKELQERIGKLEKDNDRLKKWALRERKKMNACEWLNEHYSPTEDFNTWSATITVEEKDLQYLFSNGFVNGLYRIILNRLPLENRRFYPIVAFRHTQRVYFYTFNNETWSKMPDNTLKNLFLKKINPRIYRAQSCWKKKNPISIENNKKTYYKRMVKISIDTDSLPRMMTQLRKLLSGYLELNLKNIVEYEFVF